ncbi:MAG: RHS repeat-associated core domain-containing protein [Opitutaceae bacterium]
MLQRLWRIARLQESGRGTQAPDNPIRFASKYYDSETGLYQHNHRFYSPKLGRFITRDPVGEYGGLNLYAYCANRPVDRWDHLGQFVDGGATLYLANALFSMFENIVLGKIFGGRPDRPKMFDTYTDTWRAGARFADTFGGLGTPVQLRHGPLARGCHAAEDKDKDKEAKEERRTEDAAQQNERVARVAVVLVERSIYFAKGYTEDGLTVQESIVGSGEYLSRECDDCYLEGDDFSTREELEALVRYHRSRDAVVVVVIVGHGESYIQDGNEIYGIQLIFQSEKDGIHQTLKADELDKLAAQLLEGEIAMSTVMCKSYWDTRVISNAVQIVRSNLKS